MPNSHYEKYKETIKRCRVANYWNLSEERRIECRQRAMAHFMANREQMNKRRMERYYRHKALAVEFKALLCLYDAVHT